MSDLDQNQWFNGTLLMNPLLGHRFIGTFDAAHMRVISDNCFCHASRSPQSNAPQMHNNLT